METPLHLGGHAGIVHEDLGALAWAKQKFGIKSAVDVGCGPGHMVKHMLDAGIDARGIDGDPNLTWGRPEKFIRQDYSIDGVGVMVNDGPVDLGWAVEFLEHVEEQYLPNVFKTFEDCKVLIVTAAPPGTEAGHHHVNCKDIEYWKAKFLEFDFYFDAEATVQLRAASKMTRNFMRETGMVFINGKFAPEWLKIEMNMEKYVDPLSEDFDGDDGSEQPDSVEVAIEDVPYSNKPLILGVIDDAVEEVLNADGVVDMNELHETILQKHDLGLEQGLKDMFVAELKKEAVEELAEEAKEVTKVNPVTGEPLRDNQDTILEDGSIYLVTYNKNGSIRKGSKKLIK